MFPNRNNIFELFIYPKDFIVGQKVALGMMSSLLQTLQISLTITATLLAFQEVWLCVLRLLNDTKLQTGLGRQNTDQRYSFQAGEYTVCLNSDLKKYSQDFGDFGAQYPIIKTSPGDQDGWPPPYFF